MPRRISVPDDHVALVLPAQLADEALSLFKQHRAIQLTRAARVKSDEDCRQMAKLEAAIFGELMLALLEAKEA